MSRLEEIQALVDTTAAARVIVFGSLPPHGRDLDLLVRSPDVEPVSRALIAAGAKKQGDSFIWLRADDPLAVDVVDAASWELAVEAEAQLFDSARPLPGSEQLCAPSPHHALLILARRWARGMDLDSRKRARIDALLELDPDAWDRARRTAAAWSTETSLESMRRVYAHRDGGGPAPLRTLATERKSRGDAHLRAWVGSARRRYRPSSGAIIALSGLDGSGKSTQGQILQETLQALGIEAVVSWTKIARNPSLRLIAAPVKFFIRLIRGEPPPPPPDPDDQARNYPDGPPPPPDAGKTLRSRSVALTYLWTILVALTNAATHRRTVRQNVRAGRVVLCDRYVLDSAAHLRRRYGPERRFRLQTTIIRILSPRPLRAYFLDVGPEAAYARKAEQYLVKDLQRLRELYLQELGSLPVTILDGEAPPQEIAQRILEEVWEALHSQRPR